MHFPLGECPICLYLGDVGERTIRGMNTRGAGLAAVGAALIALVSACGGSAAATDSAPTSTDIAVEAVARDEIAALGELGYPTGLATWSFVDDFVGSSGGTAQASYPAPGDPTAITVNSDATDFEQYGSSVETAVRSTVRHEFGHALVYAAGYGSSVDDELALRTLCPDRAEREPDNTRWGHECMAEAISEILTNERQDSRVEFYGGTELSAYSLGSAREIVSAVTPE